MGASETYTVKIGAGGTGTITVSPGPYRQAWSVTQVSVELASAPVGSSCNLRKNGYLVTPLIPTGDAASGEPPVTLLPSDSMTIEWAGCTAGTVAKALVFYDLVGGEAA